MGLFSQKNLVEAIEKAERRIKKNKKKRKLKTIYNMKNYRQLICKVITKFTFGGCY